MKRVFANEAVCMNCHLCSVHCVTAHSRSGDIVKAHNREGGLSRLFVEERHPASFAFQCRHCDEPACAYACITGALTKSPEGPVVYDKDKCVGCWTCVAACSYGGIRRDTVNRKILKCDLCEGMPEPACVANCPNRALVYEERG
ncbi:MAG: 4Fe-4S dicluster domain-containing protein [Candidatus Aquicultorales bacterium]